MVKRNAGRLPLLPLTNIDHNILDRVPDAKAKKTTKQKTDTAAAGKENAQPETKAKPKKNPLCTSPPLVIFGSSQDHQYTTDNCLGKVSQLTVLQDSS